MKLSNAILLLSIGSTSAFVAPELKSLNLPLRMSGFAPEDEIERPPGPKLPIKSKAIPFINAPATLDGSMAGDAGFDPLGFAKTSSDLFNYREAEVKHARLAMLAAAGWPMSELLDKKIANVFGLTPALDEAGRVPSVLNGGLGKISPLYWGFCILLAAAIDVNGSFRTSKETGYFPGKLGFDPFGLYPKDEAGQKWMQTAEIKNGRIAMIAITAFAFQEFASHVAVVDEVPFLFKPIWQTLSDSVPSYYVPPVDIPSVADIAPVELPPVDILQNIPSIETPPPPSVFESAPPSFEAPAITAPVETAAPITPPVEASPFDSFTSAPAASSSPPPAAVSAPAPPAVSSDSQDLAAAKKRIAELEATVNFLRN